MRRSAALLIPLVAIGATISTAIPAGAGQPDRAEYTVAECFSEGTEPVLRPTGPVMHLSATSSYDLYLADDGQWTKIGTNATTAVGTVAPNGKAPFRGTFSMRTDIGDFDGTWAWGMSASGRAIGRSPDGSALLKLKLYEGEADYGVVTGADVEGETCGVTTYHVMTK
jgi:hypothetical protein